jgi:hypothetical protein
VESNSNLGHEKIEDMMKLRFGKHKGKSVETIVLKHPDYAMWLLSQTDAGEPLAYIRKEVARLICVFDSKPFICRCYGCHKIALRFSLAHPSPSAYWWCEQCSPRSMGCDGLLSIGRTYEEAMQYAKIALREDHTRSLIRNIAEAKGLPKRVGEKQAMEFFAE